MGDEDSEVVPSGDDVVGLFLGTGIAFSFREFEKNHLRKPSMPVVSSSMRLFATPLLYTQFGMVSLPISGLFCFVHHCAHVRSRSMHPSTIHCPLCLYDGL